MKKRLLSFLLLLAGMQAQATHLTGTELTYKALAPNTYEVNFKVYRECGSAALPNTTGVQVKAPGCNSGRNITLNLVSLEEKSLTGTNFTAGCAGFHPANYTVGTYSGVLTFSAAEQTCTDWILSWETCCRTELANLVNASTQGIYTEAHLKLLPNLVNNSPLFDTINYNASFAAYGQPILISALAHDADDDSLVYSSVTPLSGANQPIAYSSLGAQSGFITNPNPKPPYTTTPPNTQYAQLPAGGNFSSGFPLPSFTVDWNQINPATGIPYPVVQAQPFFRLNPQTGNMAFQPALFHPNGNYGQNRYIVAVQVDEYRKINGVATKIGSVRRETYVQVYDGGSNANPVLDQVKMNGVFLEEGDIINLRPGVPMNLTFAATDQNANDAILMRSNVSDLLPGAVFTQNGTPQPSGSITWTPTATDVKDQPYYFNVVLKDNANNVRGYHERTIGVRVTNTGSVTGLRPDLAKAADFTAWPNPFTHQVSFKFDAKAKAESIIIYNLLGQQIDQITLSNSGSGQQQVIWENAVAHASGTYVARLLSADKTVQTLKFIKLQ